MEITQGKILIAQPFLNDGFFKRSVILITEHNEHGSMGFVMNNRMNLRLKDVIPKLKNMLQPLFKGGPVGDNQLFFIHQFSEEVINGIPISTSGWYWGGDFEEILKLINEGKAKFENLHFYIGYAGWEAGQLEKEIEEKAWFVAEADYKNLFQEKYEEIWGNELKRMGSNYAVLANFPQDPSLN
jgi:putative transcriptional regulator